MILRWMKQYKRMFGTRASRHEKEYDDRIDQQLTEAAEFIITYAMPEAAAEVAYKTIGSEKTIRTLKNENTEIYDKLMAAQKVIIEKLKELNDGD